MKKTGRVRGVAVMLFWCAAIGFGLPAQSTHAGVIYSPEATHMIRGTWNSAEQTVAFEYCERAHREDFVGFNCQWIGPKPGYTLQELKALRGALVRKANSTIAIDAAIILTATAAGIIGGYLVGWAIFGKATFGALSMAHIGGAGAMLGTAVPIKRSERLNPAKRNLKIHRIDGVFLTEKKNVVVEDVSREALALEQILGELL